MWYDAWLEAVFEAVEALRSHLPTIAAAVLLVLVGWVLAMLIRRWGRRLTERLFDRLSAASTPIGKAVEGSRARGNTPAIVGGFVFWIVLLVFLAAAVETLGLPVMTDLLGRLAAYAPNVLAAALIFLSGLVAARVIRSAVMRAAAAGGVSQAKGVATAAEITVIVLVLVIALEQLGVNARVLELTVAVTVGSGLAAVALAFGLGARTSVSNMIAARDVARRLSVGQRVLVDGITGTVIELTSTAVILKTAEGRAIVPARRFNESSTVILHEEG